MSDEEGLSRVKLYVLKSDGSWEDKGTGNVRIERNGSDNKIVIEREESGAEEALMLSAPVSMDDIYQIQQDTLIVWNEPTLHQELALSFQFAGGCEKIWSQIRSLQGLSVDIVLLDDGSDSEAQKTTKDALPPVIPSSLQSIVQMLNGMRPGMRETVVASIIEEKYIAKLLSLFEILEQENDFEKLRLLFIIFRLLVMLNDCTIFGLLFSDALVLKFIGVMEYDFGLSRRVRHRKFLTDVVSFKEVVALPAEVKQKVHQVYRIQYIRDTVLARILDDNTFATTNAFIVALHDEILRALSSSDAFMAELGKCIAEPQSPDQRQDAVSICQEMVNMAKSLSIHSRALFFTSFSRASLFHYWESPFGLLSTSSG